jgi:hypothetical protein
MPETIMIEGAPHIPRMYTVDVVFNVDSTGFVQPGAPSQGSTLIQNIPFKLVQITAGLIGLSNLVAPYLGVFSNNLTEFFACTFKSDQHVYMSRPTLIANAFGSIYNWIELPAVVTMKPKTTVTFEVTNLGIRDAATTLQFCLIGGEPLELIDRMK